MPERTKTAEQVDVLFRVNTPVGSSNIAVLDGSRLPNTGEGWDAAITKLLWTLVNNSMKKATD